MPDAIPPRFVLGIAGGSCCGKSTLARQVAEAITPIRSCRVIGLDAFFTRDMERGPTITLSDGTTVFDFNQPTSIDVNAVVDAIDAAAEDVVIVEGLMTLAVEPIRCRLDYRLFVHLDADLRALRRLLRDMKGGRLSTDPEFIARYYIESARVGHAKYVEPSRIYADGLAIGDDEGLRQACSALADRLMAPGYGA